MHAHNERACEFVILFAKRARILCQQYWSDQAHPKKIKMEDIILSFTNLLQEDRPERSPPPAQPQDSQQVEKFVTQAYYWPKPAFLKVLQTVPSVNKDHVVFYYPEITAALSHYIISGKDRLFKNNQWRLAIVKDDLLGKAFGVDEFTRGQVVALMRGQLIPFRGAINYNSDPEINNLYPCVNDMMDTSEDD
jgi:hypothetical protein